MDASEANLEFRGRVRIGIGDHEGAAAAVIVGDLPKAKPERPGPRGPIRERSGGRVMDIEDMGGADVEIDFDDPATSKPGDEDTSDDEA